MKKLSLFLHRLFRRAGAYARDTFSVLMMLDGALLQIENARVRAKLIMRNENLPDDQKIVELDRLLLDVTNHLETTLQRVRKILHDEPHR